MKKIPVVILCGGMGFRLREFTDTIPKSLVPIGNMPILLHVMRIYNSHGLHRFILCLGYRGEEIKQYFINRDWMSNNFTLKIGQRKEFVPHRSESTTDQFEIDFIDTGLKTPTGGRIKKIEKYVDSDCFFASYTDGLADIDLNKLLSHHLRMRKVATLTAVHPMSSFGAMEVENGLVKSFKEKPMLPGLINGGFFVFDKQIFDYLDDESVLEEEPLRRLVSEGKVAAYHHKGFWACMDTYKDFERLSTLWETGTMPHTGFKGRPPWKVWK